MEFRLYPILRQKALFRKNKKDYVRLNFPLSRLKIRDIKYLIEFTQFIRIEYF